MGTKTMNENERNELKNVLTGKENAKDFMKETGIWLPGQGITFEDFCKREISDN